jgi:hypothetical protein
MGEYIVVSGRMRPGLHPLKVAPGSQGLRPALITYDGLPSGPHSLGRQDAVQVWRSVSSFLADCATMTHQSQVLSVYGLGRKPGKDEKSVLREARSRFGKPERRQTGPHGEMRENAFMLRFDQISDIADWVADRPMPPIDLGYGWTWPTLRATVSLLFTLVDPLTDADLPYQGTEHYGGQGFDGYCASGLGESRMNVGLTNEKCWCYVALSFPFEEATEAFWAYVERLQRHLPFKLSDKHWTRWQLNKAGTAYRNRKIQPPPG